MRIIAKDILENCLDGDFVIQYTFDVIWSKDAIQALGALGQLKYYASFPKPMFQLTCPDGSFIKGVQGTSECRVIYARDMSEDDKMRLENSFTEAIKQYTGEV
jgi:hypothetical protein